MAELGVLLFFLALLALFVGFIVLIVGAVASRKKTLKVGLYIMLGGALSLLSSFALCSADPIRL